VRTVRYEIENPVAHNADADPERSPGISPARVVSEREEDAPYDGHQQAVGERIVVERERRERRVTRIDPRAFDAEEKKYRPERVEKECGENERAQGGPGRGALRGESNGEVSDEHGTSGALPARSRSRSRLGPG